MAEAIWDRILPFKGAAAKAEAAVRGAWPSAIEVTPRVPRPRLLPAADAPAFVDLFSGAGGFDLGFSRAGMRPMVCADNNLKVARTHNHNYPEVPFVLDDLGLPTAQDDVADLAGTEPFAVVGGPPCQGFSIFGRRRLAAVSEGDARRDPRNRLVFSFVDTVARLQPRWVVMENVAGFASLDGGHFVEHIVREFQELGYGTVEHRILDAADYGVPQHRRRFLLIATKGPHLIPWPKKKFFAQPTDWQKPYRTVNEAIADLVDEASQARHTCHVPMNHRPLQVERYKLIPEGGRLDVDALPPELSTGYRTDKVKNFSHVYKRLHRHKPSWTLVPGHNAFPIHPWLPRSLTVREAARLQTFPDDVEFLGAREDQCIQVGNAFPPLLAELIANNLLKAESNGWTKETVSKLAKYSLLDVEDEAVAVPG